MSEPVLPTEARALRHLASAEQDAARPPGLAAGVRLLDVRSVAVIGAGTMGGGIAMCYASAAFRFC